MVDLERHLSADGRAYPVPEEWAKLGEAIRAGRDDGYPPSLVLGSWHSPAMLKIFVGSPECDGLPGRAGCEMLTHTSEVRLRTAGIGLATSSIAIGLPPRKSRTA